MATPGVRSVLIDTNVLIRASVAGASEHDACLQTIQQYRSEGQRLWLSRQVLREYVAVLTRPQAFLIVPPVLTVTERVRYFEDSFHLAEDNAAVTRQLLTLVETIPIGGKQVHDANLVATMIVYGISHLLTLNGDDFVRFSRYITLLTPEIPPETGA